MSYLGWILVCICALMTMLANLLLRIGVKQALMAFTTQTTLFSQLWMAAKQPSLIGGIFFYVLASMVWLKIISTEPLSLAYPILVSITFLLVTSGAMLFFNEPITMLKISGIFIIILGIYVLSLA